jgi:hypothetical protein
MKRYANFNNSVLLIALLVLHACTKNNFITSADALLRANIDTLSFDTVFTSTGSVTKSFKIFNLNDQKLRLSSVTLGGGTNSFFKINVDGSPGVRFNDIEIAANDSIYVFATVSINPNSNTLPFVVQDSIMISWNGNQQKVMLQAYGQNAIFLRGRRTTTDTAWNSTLPIVILDGFTVSSNNTLTIGPGTKVYARANAPLVVNGSLRINGGIAPQDRVQFQGDRLDEPYRFFPASWPGIVFTGSSTNNSIQYANINNAYQAVIVVGNGNLSTPQLTINETTIDNAFDIGLQCLAANVQARNNLISNCGSNVVMQGGVFNMAHSTIVSYGNAYVQHKNPVLQIGNIVNGSIPVSATGTFTNCIFYGQGGLPENEIVINRQGNNPFNISFNNCLYKVKNTDPANATFNNSIRNVEPGFDTVNTGLRIYNYRLRATSPAVNRGSNAGVTIDLDGNNRPVGVPDIGCYERQ